MIVDAQSLQPIPMTLYALSGLPFYEVFFEVHETREETEDVYVRMQRIVNLLLIGRRTTTEIVRPGMEELPESLFDPKARGSS
ncbi:hypothetical protein KJ567_04915 [Candidatus Bipolaricaulota bacterium]|nr:hypothetical protein [Candidatus Bipolaricaulota bacterium]